MACDACKQNTPGDWYTITCTTAGKRNVEVLCHKCYAPAAQMARAFAKGFAQMAKVASEAVKVMDK